MRKRLRKKLGRGEFQQGEIEIEVYLRSPKDQSDFLNRWLDHIEAEGWLFGGGGSPSFEGVLFNPKGLFTTLEFEKLIDWFRRDPSVLTQRLEMVV